MGLRKSYLYNPSERVRYVVRASQQLYSPLEDFVKKHAYDEESWEQDINFEPGSFPVKKDSSLH